MQLACVFCYLLSTRIVIIIARRSALVCMNGVQLCAVHAWRAAVYRTCMACSCMQGMHGVQLCAGHAWRAAV